MRMPKWEVDKALLDNGYVLFHTKKQEEVAATATGVPLNYIIPSVYIDIRIYNQVKYFFDILAKDNKEGYVFLLSKKLNSLDPNYLVYGWFSCAQRVSSSDVEADMEDARRYFKYLKEYEVDGKKYHDFQEGFHKRIVPTHSHHTMKLNNWSGVDIKQQTSRSDMGFMDDYKLFGLYTTTYGFKFSLINYFPVYFRVEDCNVGYYFSRDALDWEITKDDKKKIESMIKELVEVPKYTYNVNNKDLIASFGTLFNNNTNTTTTTHINNNKDTTNNNRWNYDSILDYDEHDYEHSHLWYDTTTTNQTKARNDEVALISPEDAPIALERFTKLLFDYMEIPPKYSQEHGKIKNSLIKSIKVNPKYFDKLLSVVFWFMSDYEEHLIDAVSMYPSKNTGELYYEINNKVLEDTFSTGVKTFCQVLQFKGAMNPLESGLEDDDIEDFIACKPILPFLIAVLFKKDYVESYFGDVFKKFSNYLKSKKESEQKYTVKDFTLFLEAVSDYM
jgi:hypothetical protein